MSKVSAYYWYQEMHLDGTVKHAHRVEEKDIKEFLRDCEIPIWQIEFARTVCANSPGVPFDLHKLDDDGELSWTARLTFKINFCCGYGWNNGD